MPMVHPTSCPPAPNYRRSYGPEVRRYRPNSSGAPGRSCTPRRRCTRSMRSEEHTSELQSRGHLVCRLLLEKKNLYIVKNLINHNSIHTTSRDSKKINMSL